METAFLKVHNDITLNMDYGKVTALTLLYLSAAFDIINNTILMDCLSFWYDVSGLPEGKSYLSGRYMRVNFGDCFCHHLIFHVVFLRVQFWDITFYTSHNPIVI